jgi:hypothetical protein
MSETVEIKKDQLEILLSESENKSRIIEDAKLLLQQKNKEIQDLQLDIGKTKDCLIQVMEVIGLAKNGIIDESIITGKGKWLPKVLNAGTSIFLKMQQAKMPGIGAMARKEITQKFAFLDVLKPMLAKYNDEMLAKKIAQQKNKI